MGSGAERPKAISAEAAVGAHMLEMLSERARSIYAERISLAARGDTSDADFDEAIADFNALPVEEQLDPELKASEPLDARKLDEPITLSFGNGRSVVLTRDSNGHYNLMNPDSRRL